MAIWSTINVSGTEFDLIVEQVSNGSVDPTTFTLIKGDLIDHLPASVNLHNIQMRIDAGEDVDVKEELGKNKNSLHTLSSSTLGPIAVSFTSNGTITDITTA